MKYNKIIKAKFIDRPNRFVANVEVESEEISCHVKNTGRCRELLTQGATVYLEESDKSNRKYKYSLVTVEKGERLVNMDSQAPNKIVEEWLMSGGLFSDIKLLRPERTYKNSRFDFYCEHGDKKTFIEVKGVTLEKGGVVSFPDAPTKRGTKHVNELIDCIIEGYEAYIIFVVQMNNVLYFEPNNENDPDFTLALKTAKSSGVKIIAIDCEVTKDSVIAKDEIKVQI